MTDYSSDTDSYEYSEPARFRLFGRGKERSAGYYRLHGIFWLVGALICLGLWFFLWIGANPSEQISKPKDAPATASEAIGGLPASIDTLIEGSRLVSPLNLETIIKDGRSYPDEFKDKAYFVGLKNKWAVQVMDVAQHDVILNFLENRNDREKFAYFRYSDKNNQTRYLLTYGVYSNFQEALGAARLVDFGLPSSVKLVPEEMKRFVSMIDNYEYANKVVDLKIATPPTVSLQTTNTELPAKSETQDELSESADSADTKKQKDQEKTKEQRHEPVSIKEPESNHGVNTEPTPVTQPVSRDRETSRPVPGSSEWLNQ